MNDGQPILLTCFRCQQPFCDRCLPFLVNRLPACEPCANTLIAGMRPRGQRAALVLVPALLLFVLGNASHRMAFGQWSFRWLLLSLIPMLAAARIAWRVLEPDAPSQEARVTPRLPGTSLPIPISKSVPPLG